MLPAIEWPRVGAPTPGRHAPGPSGFLASTRCLGATMPVGWRVGLTLAVGAAYVAAFLALYDELGLGVAPLAALPVCLVAWLFGVRSGLVAGLATVPLHAGLITLLLARGWEGMLENRGGVGTIVLLLVAAACGGMRELSLRMHRQSGQLELEAARRAALLRIARRVAAEADADRVLQMLLAEARGIAGGDVGVVRRWDEERQALVAVAWALPTGAPPGDRRVGDGLTGRAAAARAPVLVSDYRSEVGGEGALPGVGAAVALPLLHEGQLMGALFVGSSQAGPVFAPGDVEALEVLGGLVAAVLVGLERSRLEGVLMAARTTQHELRNSLAATVAAAELLSLEADASEPVRVLAEQSLQGAEAATRALDRLQGLARVVPKGWGAGVLPTIDLERSKSGQG